MLFLAGRWQGFAALADFNLFWLAYRRRRKSTYLRAGTDHDVHVFNRLRQNRRRWWRRLCFNAVWQYQASRTFLHCVLAKPPCVYGRTPGYGNCAGGYCALKVLISIIFFLPMYGVAEYVAEKLADKSEISPITGKFEFVFRVVIRWANEPLWPFIEGRVSSNLVKYAGIGLLVMGACGL